MSTDAFDLTITDEFPEPGRRKNNFTATVAPTVSDDSGDGYEQGSRWLDTVTDRFYECADATLGAAVWKSGGVTDADYLVGTAHSGLSAEIVVGTSPGGELGGTWASPTVDATHSGSSHAGVVTAHEAAGDPHPGYVLESALQNAGHWEVIMVPGITAPPEPLLTLAEDDWIYGFVPG